MWFLTLNVTHNLHNPVGIPMEVGKKKFSNYFWFLEPSNIWISGLNLT